MTGKILGGAVITDAEGYLIDPETWKSIVRQPYDRTDELVKLARHVPNISAKHGPGHPMLSG